MRFGSEDGSLILTDEPELSLHPRLVAYTAQLFRAASERLQIVVATKWEVFIGRIVLGDLVVAGIDEKFEAHFQQATELNLGEWFSEYYMDELWLKGQLEPRA